MSLTILNAGHMLLSGSYHPVVPPGRNRYEVESGYVLTAQPTVMALASGISGDSLDEVATRALIRVGKPIWSTI